jgi:DNA-binding MarR family transcriptional regulator
MPVKAPLFRAAPGGGPGLAAAGGVPEPGAVEAVRALTRASRVMERASGGLSLALYRVLSAVAAGDQRASRVAQRLALGKPTVSASVDALCSRGLLTRSGVAGDQRAVQLSLTESGTDLLAEVEVAMTAALEVLAARTGRRDDVISALVALGSAIDESIAERRR